MSYETILFEVEDGVATLTLNRPDVFNAVTAQMLTEIKDALNIVEKDDTIRALLLTGAGKGFCSGQDLNDRNVSPGADRPDLGWTLRDGYNPVVTQLYELEVPTICAVNGTAAGAGANLALACDMVIASEKAKFIQLFSNIGLIPDSAGTWILPRLVGLAQAKALAMTARPVMADEAVSMGMIYKASPADSFLGEAKELAASLAKRPTLGFALTKKAFHASFQNNLTEQLDLERKLQRVGGFSDDYLEGVTAFKEKRAPNYKGK
jgi:2-(1,2-epoxy-1,2-dihydrophenyl)acetyl-CoA isomerase